MKTNQLTEQQSEKKTIKLGETIMFQLDSDLMESSPKSTRNSRKVTPKIIQTSFRKYREQRNALLLYTEVLLL